MKLKLLIISIVVLLSLVAYKQYQDFATLRSINSYETCAASKGGIIQESYPAICITRLGSRFKQPTIIIPIAPIPPDWKEVVLPHWSFLAPPNWYISNCHDKYFIVGSEKNSNNDECPISGDLFISRQSREQVSEPGYKQYLDLPNTQAVTTDILIDDKKATKQIVYLPGGSIEGPRIYVEFPTYIDSVAYDSTNEDIVSNILSTFHFLD